MSASSTRTGLRVLRAALVGIVVFVVAAGGWITWKALENPDVRVRRPRSLDAAAGFDHSFWIPLWLTVVVGALLVAAVLGTAYRRMRRGEDLYRQRLGQGLRRRGERAIEEEGDR